jgi:spermidine synthase
VTRPADIFLRSSAIGVSESGGNLRYAGLLAALVVLFAVSGATSLVYETAWARQFQLVFGVTQVAISTVLASFMAGLAIGSFLASRYGHRFPRPLLAYAVLEALIGLYALAVPALIRSVTPLAVAFWRAFEPGPLGLGAFQFVVLGLLLLPPTLCMGATLPLLSRVVARTREEAGYRVGLLYGVNTLGAVAGATLAGFVLLPRLGMSETVGLAVRVNFAVAVLAAALSAWGGSRIRADGAEPAGTLAVEPIRGDDRRTLRTLGWIAASAGLASLVYEVAWFRLMTLILGASAYAFTIMLVAFLIGIGFGGWFGGAGVDWSRRRGGREAILRHLAWLECGVAVLAVVAMCFYNELPYLFLGLFDLTEEAPTLLWPAKLLLALAVMLPPALLSGAAFPYLVQAAADHPRRLHRPVGRLYAFNTLGAIVGAAAGGLLLLPLLTLRGAIVVAAMVNVTASALALYAARPAGRMSAGRARLPAFAGAAVLVLAVLTPWNPLLMASGLYVNANRLLLAERNREGVRRVFLEPNELLFYEEGLSSVVTVGREKETGNVWLANNGKVDASTQGDLITQLLLGHLPMLFRPNAGTALVIGYASGITTGAVTRYRAPARIDVVELERAVVEADRFFDEYNHRPLEDERVHLYVNDGRNHLLAARDGRYDVVVSEPPNPWISGVANLFTREFFELGHRKLSDGGVWSQWIQIYGMAPADLRSLLATFTEVYDHVRVFRVDEADLILLGSDAPLPLDVRAVRRSLTAEPQAALDLRRVDMERAVSIVGLHLMGGDVAMEVAGDVEPNTDDNMRIEYAAPLLLHRETEIENSRMLEERAETALDAVHGRDDMLALGRAYFETDLSMKRALAVARAAVDSFPDDPSVRTVYMMLLKEEAKDVLQP